MTLSSIAIAVSAVAQPLAWGDEAADLAAAKAKPWDAVPVGAFADSINHAIMGYEKGEAPYARYAPTQIVHIAENLLAWQNPDGGWPKNQDWLRVLDAAQLARLPAARGKATSGGSSLDNRTTWPQIDYLAQVHRQTGLQRYARAATRGIEYILRNQRKSGGWRGADVDAITFNDDVMTGVLRTFKDILEMRDRYGFVGQPFLDKVQTAYDKGLDCLLKCQIKVGDRLTAWCQQHDHRTLRPTGARSYEKPSIVTAESVGIVRFLMTIDNPPPAIVKAVEAAVAWFDRVKIEGVRIEKVKAKPVRFKHHWNDYDLVEVQDSAAPPIWTRYYDLKTEKPFFCTRAGKITTDYTQLSRERRTGYSWYGYYPARLLTEEYPRWHEKWSPGHHQ